MDEIAVRFAHVESDDEVAGGNVDAFFQDTRRYEEVADAIAEIGHDFTLFLVQNGCFFEQRYSARCLAHCEERINKLKHRVYLTNFLYSNRNKRMPSDSNAPDLASSTSGRRWCQ